MTQSNPVYYSISSLSSGRKPSSRTISLHKGPNHNGFGLFLGEDVPNGLYVVTVERNSPASEANIQPGDRILAVNGQPISSMSKDPKEIVVEAAMNSNTLTFTIESTDTLQTIQPSLLNSSTEKIYNNTNDNNKKQQQQQQNSTAQIGHISTDLESYLKSLFANENVQITPAKSSNNNEFFITSKTPGTSNSISNTFPSRNLPTNDYIQEHQTQQPHSQRGRRPRRPRHPKQVLLVTKETQTSANEDDDDIVQHDQSQISSQRQYPSYPSMGTSQRILRSQASSSPNELLESKVIPTNKNSRDTNKTSSSISNNTNDKSTESRSNNQHMVNIVEAAMNAKRNQEQSNTRDQPTTRDQAGATGAPNSRSQPSSRDQIGATGAPNSRSQPSSRDQVGATVPNSRDQPSGRDQVAAGASNSRNQSSGRDQVAAGGAANARDQPHATGRDAVAKRDSNPPPPYTPSESVNNQGTPDQGVYNVRDAEQGQESANQAINAKAPVRLEGIREVTLHRLPDFQGFGFHLQYNKIYYLVHRVEEGSPADKADLQANDVILKINQQTTDGMAHGAFVQIVNASTDVTFVIQHLDEYLRSNPVPPRNPNVASAVTAAITEESDKHKSGISKALGKISSR
ncbi:hypothetical protein I4U23_019500 [Adineta vaga]|nr:hypothetical protein I4U23_019500 [Adineta vaga]